MNIITDYGVVTLSPKTLRFMEAMGEDWKEKMNEPIANRWKQLRNAVEVMAAIEFLDGKILKEI